MIRGMFRTFGMEESRRDDYDIDACLEHSEEEMQESFLEFYHDVLPEFKSVGKVLQFKVRWHQEAFLPSSCLCCKTDSLIPFKNIYRFHLFLSSNRSAVTMNHTWEETFMFSLTRKKSLSHFPSLCNWSNTSEKNIILWLVVSPERSNAKMPSSNSMGGGMQAGSFTVRYHLLHGGRMPYVVSYFLMLTACSFTWRHSHSV